MEEEDENQEVLAYLSNDNLSIVETQGNIIVFEIKRLPPGLALGNTEVISEYAEEIFLTTCQYHIIGTFSKNTLCQWTDNFPFPYTTLYLVIKTKHDKFDKLPLEFSANIVAKLDELNTLKWCRSCLTSTLRFTDNNLKSIDDPVSAFSHTTIESLFSPPPSPSSTTSTPIDILPSDILPSYDIFHSDSSIDDHPFLSAFSHTTKKPPHNSPPTHTPILPKIQKPISQKIQNRISWTNICVWN